MHILAERLVFTHHHYHPTTHPIALSTLSPSLVDSIRPEDVCP